MQRLFSHPTFVLFAITLASVALAHYLALQFFLYWRYVWFDVPMHFFGGAMLALMLHSAPVFRDSFPKGFLTRGATLVFVLFVGLSWEVFELLAGVPVEDNFVFDTSLDLTMDLIGGYVGYFLARRFATV